MNETRNVTLTIHENIHLDKEPDVQLLAALDNAGYIVFSQNGRWIAVFSNTTVAIETDDTQFTLGERLRKKFSRGLVRLIGERNYYLVGSTGIVATNYSNDSVDLDYYISEPIPVGSTASVTPKDSDEWHEFQGVVAGHMEDGTVLVRDREDNSFVVDPDQLNVGKE